MTIEQEPRFPTTSSRNLSSSSTFGREKLRTTAENSQAHTTARAARTLSFQHEGPPSCPISRFRKVAGEQQHERILNVSACIFNPEIGCAKASKRQISRAIAYRRRRC